MIGILEVRFHAGVGGKLVWEGNVKFMDIEILYCNIYVVTKFFGRGSF